MTSPLPWWGTDARPGRYGGAAADIFPTPVYPEYGTNALFSSPTQRTVDNFWLHIAVEGGALGLLALVAAILAVLLPALDPSTPQGGRP